MLIARHLLPRAEAARWVERSKSEGLPVDTLLLREEVFTRESLLEAFENHYFCPAVDLREPPYDPIALRLISRTLAQRHQALPLAIDNGTVQVAFANPDDQRSRDAVLGLLTRPVTPVVSLPSDIRAAITAHYARLVRDLNPSVTRPAAMTGSTTEPKGPRIGVIDLAQLDAVALVERLFIEAAGMEATDIHIESQADAVVIRFRLDGLLQQIATVSKELGPSIVSRLKILSDMDISERRKPQDGRYSMTTPKGSIDMRFASMPSQFGEKLTIRLLRKDTSLLTLDCLNMPPHVRKRHREMVSSPHGLFLVTGPTGSGKTTTLYSTLGALDLSTLNVITLEDPIEYSLPGITQVQIREEAGLTFAEGLESILRHDPDVILVGEIRDAKTLEIACRAALTGHKVFSTLHTIDACQAVTRLIDIGCPPFLVAATLRGVLAQRLVRVICDHCKESYAATETELALMGFPDIRQLYRGAGCPACHRTGYKGRRAIYEYLPVDDSLHRLVLERVSPQSIRHAARRNGMTIMAESAKAAVLAGTTTVAEVFRVLLADEGKEQLCQRCQRVVNADFSVCPFCQHHLREYCSSCRKPVESGWDACPSCGTAVEREWTKVFCSSCSAPMPAHGEICQYCGASPL